MSIDQHRKKAMRGRKPCDDHGYGTIPDGLGYNDPWSLSIGHPADRTDPDLFKASWKVDADMGRLEQADCVSEYNDCADYTRP